jgi:tRNA1(Val) A37 N6-methylase TrmN6
MSISSPLSTSRLSSNSSKRGPFSGPVLDVGSGTGRAIEFLESRLTLDRIEGVEPVEELRVLAQQRGVTSSMVTPNDCHLTMHHSMP